MIRNVIKKYDGKSPLSARGKEDVLFRIHFPRGELSRRMSAWEIKQIIFKKFVALGPYLSHMPTVAKAHRQLVERFALTPREVLDEVYQWATIRWHIEEDDIVEFAPAWVEEVASMEERIAADQPIVIPMIPAS